MHSLSLSIGRLWCVYGQVKRTTGGSRPLKIGGVKVAATSPPPATMPLVRGITGETFIQRTPPYFHLNGDVEKKVKIDSDIISKIHHF